MTPEEAKIIQDEIEKNSKIILKNLANITKNKNFISGKTGKEIEYETNLSPEEIYAAVEYMKANDWVKAIQNTDQDNQYKFIRVEITDKGRELVKK